MPWEDLRERCLFVRHRGDCQTKGNAEPRVPLRGGTEGALRTMHEDALSGPVLTDRDGEAIRPDRVTRRFKDMVEVAGLDERLQFHSLRHTCASWLAMQGVPLRTMQAIMGHSEISVTERYSHLQPEVMSQAMQQTFNDD